MFQITVQMSHRRGDSCLLQGAGRCPSAGKQAANALFCRKAAAVCPCFPGPQERVETAAKEKILQICDVEEEQGVSNVEDASGLRALSSSSFCLLVGVRTKWAGGNLEEGLVQHGRPLGISCSDAGVMAQVSPCIAWNHRWWWKSYVPSAGHGSCILFTLST